MLSRALVDDGRFIAARDTAAIAITMTEGLCRFAYLHRHRAAAELAIGDTTAAEHDLAMALSTRNFMSGAFGDSASIVLGRHYNTARWSALVDSAQHAGTSCSNDWATP